MGLYESTKKLLTESGLGDAKLHQLTDIPARWIQRFRTKDSHKEILDRIECINKELKKHMAKQKRKDKENA